MFWIPLTEASGTVRLLWTRVCRPEGNAPARVMVFIHGTAPTEARRRRLRPLGCGSEAAQWFLSRGGPFVERYLAARPAG
jgi:hypothetical protein